MAAEASTITASTRSVSGAPSKRIKAPARPGPTTSAPEVARPLRAWASTRRSRGTTWVSTICAALPASVDTVPSMKPTTYNQVMFNQPAQAATGTLATATAMLSSPAMYTGSLRTRSSHTPPGSENSTNGTISTAVNKPICAGEAFSSTAAVSGRASKVICPPKELHSTDNHSRR